MCIFYTYVKQRVVLTKSAGAFEIRYTRVYTSQTRAHGYV